MLPFLLTLLLAFSTARTPEAGQVSTEPSTAAEWQAVADRPCYIVVNSDGDVTDTCP